MPARTNLHFLFSLPVLLFILAFIAFILAVTTVPAVAQNYIGLSGGLMKYEDTGADIDAQGFTLLAAGQYDPVIAIEFSYTSIASVEANKQENDASLMALSGLVRSPGEGFEPFLRLGIGRSNTRITGGRINYDKNKKGLVYGLGADITLNYNSAIRVEYVEGDFDGAELSRFSIGSIYRF